MTTLKTQKRTTATKKAPTAKEVVKKEVVNTKPLTPREYYEKRRKDAEASATK